VKEVLKEEFLRVKLFNKLQRKLENRVIQSEQQQIRWNTFLVEKEYPNHPNLSCDIFLQGNTANSSKYSARSVYEKEQKRDAWIELKFLTPTNANATSNRGSILNDFLRLYYFLKNYKEKSWHIERYFILFLLCGKYKKNRSIERFFGGDPMFGELFFPKDLNIDQHYVFKINQCISQNLRFANFKKALNREILRELQKKYEIDLLYLNRKYITPIPFFNDKLTFLDMNKNLFGYVFQIKGYRQIKSNKVI